MVRALDKANAMLTLSSAP